MKSKLICLLSSLLFVCIALYAEEPKVKDSAVKRVGVEEYDQLRTNKNTVLLDVRTPAEFEKGHIPGATNIDINSLQFAEKVGALDKDKTYLVNCAVGMRSAKACAKMETIGFKNLYDLGPGFDGWKKARKPIEK